MLDREWLQVKPCSTTEQDKLKTFSNVRRSLTKAIRVFHDTEWLHKQSDLGEMCVSLTAFRLDELPSLVRQSKQTRRLSQSVVGEATLRLESELGAARRDSDRSARALEVERAKTARLEEEGGNATLVLEGRPPPPAAGDARGGGGAGEEAGAARSEQSRAVLQGPLLTPTADEAEDARDGTGSTRRARRTMAPAKKGVRARHKFRLARAGTPIFAGANVRRARRGASFGSFIIRVTFFRQKAARFRRLSRHSSCVRK